MKQMRLRVSRWAGPPPTKLPDRLERPRRQMPGRRAIVSGR